MIGIFKKILFCFNRKKFWKLVRKEAFYTNWRENNPLPNNSFREVLNDKTRQ